MPQKSPVTTPPKPSQINERSLLIVECNEGTRERRRGEESRVLINGEYVGVVDDRIFLDPGSYQVSVHCGQHSTPAFSCTLPPGQAVVLEYRSQLKLGLPVTIAFGGVACLTFAVFSYNGNLSRSDRKIIGWMIGGLLFGLLILAERCGLRLRHAENLRQRSDSPTTLANWLDAPKDEEGRSLPARPGRIMIHLCVEPVSIMGIVILNPAPKVYINGTHFGPPAQVMNLPAGRYTVQVRGWLERSSEVEIRVEPGELIELQVSRTGMGFLALLALAIPAGGSVVTMIYYQPLIQWAFALMLAGFATGVAAALLVTKLGHTLDLHPRR